MEQVGRATSEAKENQISAAPSAAHHQLPHIFHGNADCDHSVRAVVWWHGDGDAYGSRFLHACTMSRGEKFVPGPAPSTGSPLVTAHRVVMPWLCYSWTEVDLALMLAWSPAEWTKSQAPWQWRSHKKRGLEQLRNSNPRVALLCFPTTADALSQLSASWLEEPKSCCPDLPLVLVGLRPAAATTERITEEEAMAAAGAAASAYFECCPESWAGCDELVQAIVRLGLSLDDDVAVVLPEVHSRSAFKVAMPEFYNGAIDFKPGEEDDQRPKIDAACAPGCTSAWKNYLKCGDRIEAKGSGDCSSWYMDYHQCLDQCAVKSLFKVTN